MRPAAPVMRTRFFVSDSLVDLEPLVLLVSRQHVLDQYPALAADLLEQRVAVAQLGHRRAAGRDLAVDHRDVLVLVAADQLVPPRLETLDLPGDAPAHTVVLVSARAIDGELVPCRDLDVAPDVDVGRRRA